MTKCKFCLNPGSFIFYSTILCDQCREEICFLCSEQKKDVVFKNVCPSHKIDTPFKGNRFMEDKAFNAGGPFEFEPE